MKNENNYLFTWNHLWALAMYIHVQNKVIQESASEKQPVCGFTSSSRIFFFGDENNPVMETLSLTVKSFKLKVPWPFCTEILLPCHTCCDTESLFFEISSEGPTGGTGLSWPFLNYIRNEDIERILEWRALNWNRLK